MPNRTSAPTLTDEPAADPAVVVVTGGGGGIGAACVAGFVRAGHPVAVLDRDGQAAQVVADAHHGARVLALGVDVADPAAVTAVMDEVAQRLGPPTVLVNAAGVLCVAEPSRVEPAALLAMLQVNLMGVVHCCQAVAPFQVQAGGGSVVTVASNAARVPRSALGAYGATKAAAAMYTRSLGVELAGHGVRCNVVLPGTTDTPMLRALWPDAEQGQREAVAGEPGTFRLGIPLGRVADPQDVAQVVVFLAGPGARHVTMQEVLVDGGASLGG